MLSMKIKNTLNLAEHILHVVRKTIEAVRAHPLEMEMTSSSFSKLSPQVSNLSNTAMITTTVASGYQIYPLNLSHVGFSSLVNLVSSLNQYNLLSLNLVELVF